MTLLGEAIGDADFSFVVGKGGVGKTTAAGALALELADGAATHLISTDPAHSLGDLFGQQLTGGPAVAGCSSNLRLEEFDAAAGAATWTARASVPVTAIIERGTYLDDEDVAGFARLALPGLDELMAVLRLVELVDTGERVVVDTAPTGHTMRMLDAMSTHEGLARALRAMADKAAAVASGLARRSIRLEDEAFIDELEARVAAFRARVLGRAVFVVAARADDVVVSETRRLVDALNRRRLRVAAIVWAGAAVRFGEPCIVVPWLPEATGCNGLRTWLAAQRSCAPATAALPAAVAGRGTPGGDARAAAGPSLSALPWLETEAPQLLLFAGKGGVGKTTCAAAAALGLAASRDVLLCSTDPAGSLDDVFGADVTGTGRAVPRLRVLQIDAEAQLERFRAGTRADVVDALGRFGLSGAATLDRRVIDAVLELAPPGIDEFAALATLLDAAAADETVIIDAAPTGHFLRLLTLPGLALDWTRQIMRLIVKYRIAGHADRAAEALLYTARELRSLQQRLRDGARSGVVVVTADEPMIRTETARLLDGLSQAGIPVAAVLENLGRGADAPPGAGRHRVVRAPRLRPPPVGAPALRDFVDQWKVEP